MILVLSTEHFEESTEQVLDWLDHLAMPYVRLNGEDLGKLQFELDPRDPETSWIAIDGRRIDLAEITAIWYRRTGQRQLEELFPIPSIEVRVHMVQHLLTEMRALKHGVYALLEDRDWLSHPDHASPNKLHMLRTAHRLGMAIPPTKIVSTAQSLRELRQCWGPLITKCLSDCRMMRYENQIFTQYTTSPDPILDDLPDRIFPTLVQACIEKAFEIRTFYFRGSCYSMAIFSQDSAQTSTDFRIYNYKKLSRNIPYKLPESLEAKVRKLMDAFDLETGSLDFMVGKDDTYYFLEINPVGQFGMVSHPCNYQLEKHIAQRLGEVAA